MQIQIIWLLQKPTDLDLHYLQRQGISGFSRTRVNTYIYLGEQQFLQDCMCTQRRFILACASAYTDQSLRGPLEEALDPWLSIEFHKKTLIRRRGCTGWSASFFCWRTCNLLGNVVFRFILKCSLSKEAALMKALNGYCRNVILIDRLDILVY